MRSYVRRKEIHCGEDYLEIDLYRYTSNQQEASSRKRGKKKYVSAPKQMNLNDKNARRYFVQLINANFDDSDMHVTLTYKNEFLPKTIEAAEKEAYNFIRRLQYRRKKDGLPQLKYALVTAYRTGKDGETPVRIHHHIIASGGLDRDLVEGMWRRPRKKGQKSGEKIGRANADRLQPGEDGFEGLCRYLVNQPGGKKRWSTSQNLERPWYRTNDKEYSKRRLEQIAKEPPDPQFWETRYPGFGFTSIQQEHNEITGWSVYVKMRRVKPEKAEGRIQCDFWKTKSKRDGDRRAGESGG